MQAQGHDASQVVRPAAIGPLLVSHRVVMARPTRMRADPATQAPRPLNAAYDAQRASQGGLIIAEAYHPALVPAA